MKVIKRDGREVEFNKQRIREALFNAFQDVDGELTESASRKASEIANYVEKLDKESMSVEEIQNIVEEKLMASNRKDVARAYILYRDKRNRVRQYNTKLMKDYKEKIEASNVVNQNANVDEHSFGGRIGEAGSMVLKDYALNNCMSEMARNNHLNNEIYIHDLDSYAVGMHNCAARDTKFLTKKYGVRSFEEFDNGDIVEVLTHTGEFKKATVKKYGTQKLNKITFSFAGQRFVTERFTDNHRWILDNGTITTNLAIGDKIFKPPINIRKFNFDSATKREQFYWCLGFILADGTEACRWSHGIKKEDIKFVRMRLCGRKTKYEYRFKDLAHSTKEMDNGDLYLSFSSVIGLRKIFPNLTLMSYKEKLALFDGLYSADGQFAGSRKSILTTNEQIASFIKDEAPSLGYYILGIEDKEGETTNYKTRGFAKNFIFIGDANKYYWTVVDIQPDAEEEVWCLEVEDNNSFVLPNGIVTGNCLSVPFDDLLANGFKTRQTDVRPANSVNTAMQLVAVLFQLQSLQQFGGVSATHLDWTMVPYVRKSFYKHYIDGAIYIENKNCKWLQEHVYDYLNDPECFEKEQSIDAAIWKENSIIYKYAMDMTEKELEQAVEGLYHNLNTLQSRSGNQLNTRWLAA